MSILSYFKKRFAAGDGVGAPPEDAPVTSESVKETYSGCEDFQSRKVLAGGLGGLEVTVCWLDGLVSGAEVAETVIGPVADPLRCPRGISPDGLLSLIMGGLAPAASAKTVGAMGELTGALASGCCAIILDSLKKAAVFECKSSQTRSISEPTVEKTVKGAKDAFVETLRVNTALVRRRLRSPELKIEQLSVGRRSKTQVAVMYVKGIVNEDILCLARSRLDRLDVDALLSSGTLEQYIVDSPSSPFPQLLHTERPDKFALELLAGRVGLICDGLPIGFMLPAALSDFMHVGEDRSWHFITSSLLRLLRYFAMLAAVLLPGLYVAIAMYHQEMLPLKLLQSTINSKQEVPFSTAAEVLGMLAAFELLQEAGMRLPSSVGDTVSIIGALIVGQSAVEAKVISPVAMIIVAAAGICGYTQPSQDMSAALRLLRFVLVALAVALGMFGVVLGLTLTVWRLCSIESFGVSYMSPFAEGGFVQSLKALVQPPLWLDKFRAPALKTGDKRTQK